MKKNVVIAVLVAAVVVLLALNVLVARDRGRLDEQYKAGVFDRENELVGRHSPSILRFYEAVGVKPDTPPTTVAELLAPLHAEIENAEEIERLAKYWEYDPPYSEYATYTIYAAFVDERFDDIAAGMGLDNDGPAGRMIKLWFEAHAYKTVHAESARFAEGGKFQVLLARNVDPNRGILPTKCDIEKFERGKVYKLVITPDIPKGWEAINDIKTLISSRYFTVLACLEVSAQTRYADIEIPESEIVGLPKLGDVVHPTDPIVDAGEHAITTQAKDGYQVILKFNLSLVGYEKFREECFGRTEGEAIQVFISDLVTYNMQKLIQESTVTEITLDAIKQRVMRDVVSELNEKLKEPGDAEEIKFFKSVLIHKLMIQSG